MKISSFLFLFLSCAHLLNGQSNYEKFKKLYENNDSSSIKLLLIRWEKDDPDDPEFYTSAFNYFFSKSKEELLILDSDSTIENGYTIKDSSGKIVSYLHSKVGFAQKKLETAIAYIDQGINKFPDRLDMRFGKCYAYKVAEEYRKFTDELIVSVEYSNKNNNNWLWIENKKIEAGESFFLDGIQDYLVDLYDTGDDNLLENMKEIGVATLKYYPENIKILTTTSIAYILTKNYEAALVYLKRAEKINPTDFIVLNNIAEMYSRKGDKENAIKYYELTIKYGDDSAINTAKERINELKNK